MNFVCLIKSTTFYRLCGPTNYREKNQSNNQINNVAIIIIFFFSNISVVHEDKTREAEVLPQGVCDRW